MWTRITLTQLKSFPMLQLALRCYVYERSKRFNIMMDGFSELFCCLLLAGEGFVMWDDNSHLEFINITYYSSRPGHLEIFIRLILSSMPATKVNELKARLSSQLESMTEQTPCEQRSSTTSALEWVSQVKTPYRLQYHCSSAIHRSLASRSLPSAASLGIPECLHQYLLFK